jgi:putative hydrolase of the HAD superfamily
MKVGHPPSEASLAEVRVVFFDATGTLIHLPRGVAFHYADVARRHGADFSEADLDRAFHAAWKEMPGRASTIGPRPNDDKEWWRALVDRTLDRLQPVKLDRLAFFEELYAEFTLPGVWALFPEIREVLEILRARSRLGVISNFDSRLRTIFDRLGITGFFDEIVISSEVGADKPDEKIFQIALARFGVAPYEALHVGDDPENDWRAAQRAGLRVFPLNRATMDLYPLIRSTSVGMLKTPR